MRHHNMPAQAALQHYRPRPVNSSYSPTLGSLPRPSCLLETQASGLSAVQRLS